MPNQLREIRVGKGCKQRELAVRAGVSAAMLCDIEKYDYRPGQAVRERIAEALVVPIDAVWPELQEETR